MTHDTVSNISEYTPDRCPVCGDISWAEAIRASVDATPSTEFVIEGIRHCPNERDLAHYRYWVLRER